MKKIHFGSKLAIISALIVGFSSVAEARDRREVPRPQRFDAKVSNDSDRNRNVRNERIADYQRARQRQNEHQQRYSRGNRFYNSRYYSNGGFYGNRYSSYGYPYHFGRPRTSLSIGVGSGYYGSEYSGSYRRDDDRPVYRGRQVSESGDASLEVAVQKKLANLGYYRGSLDGDIGPASRRAISKFQRDNDLEETGRIDRELVSSLGLS